MRAEQIVAAIDGDSFRTDRRTIQLYGIDAPVLSQRFGQDAKTVLWGRLRIGNIKIEVIAKSTEGVDIAIVTAGDENLNVGMLSRGMAWRSQGNDNDVLKSAENVAKSMKMGVWYDDENISPWDYRAGSRIPSVVRRPIVEEKPKLATDIFVFVTQYGDRYHRSGCGHLRYSRQAIRLSEAYSAYEPCDHCRPPVVRD